MLVRVLLVGLAYTIVLSIALVRARHRERLFSSDSFGYYLYLPSLVIDGDLDFWNQIATYPGQRIHDFYDVVPETGLTANGFPIGCALIWLPFFLIAHLAVLGLNALGMSIPANGFGPAYEWPVYCGIFAFGLLGLWYLRRLLEELWGGAVANVTLVYMVSATALAAYVWFEPNHSHLTSATLITMFFYYLNRTLRTRDHSLLNWVRLGVLLGLIALVRAPDALVAAAAAGVGISVAFSVASEWRQRGIVLVKCALTLALTSFLIFLPQILYWKLVFGHYLLTPTNSNYDQTSWLAPDFLYYFLGVRRGLFVWTPLAIAAVAGLGLGVRRSASIVPHAALVFVLAVYFNSSIHMWWIGESFVDRRLVDYYVCLALGLGYLFSLRPQWIFSYKLHALGALLIAFNWVLMLRYFTHELPESAAITLDNLYLKTLTFPMRFLERFFL